MNQIKIIVLSLFFLASKVNGEVIIYSRISSPDLLSQQCMKQKDDFAVKVLKLLENAASPDPFVYDKLELSHTFRTHPANVDCTAVLDEQYKHLQSLAMHQGSFSDILLLKHVIHYLNELYEYNPFDKKGRLVLLVRENVDKNKPIYPFLLETFRYR